MDPLKPVEDEALTFFRIPKRPRIQTTTDEPIVNGETVTPAESQTHAKRRININEYLTKRNITIDNSPSPFKEEPIKDNFIKPNEIRSEPIEIDDDEQRPVCKQFYTDILESLRMENENEIIAEETLVGTRRDQLPESNLDAIVQPLEKVSSGILLLPGMQKSTRKSIKWADENGGQLENVKIFEACRPTFEEYLLFAGLDLDEFEVFEEREMLEEMFQNEPTYLPSSTTYGPLVEIFIPEEIQRPVVRSLEKVIQLERQKRTLKDIFLPCVNVPDTASEPTIQVHVEKSWITKDIPLDDCENEEHHIDKGLKESSVPLNLPPELADLLSRAHQSEYVSQTVQPESTPFQSLLDNKLTSVELKLTRDSDSRMHTFQHNKIPNIVSIANQPPIEINNCNNINLQPISTTSSPLNYPVVNPPLQITTMHQPHLNHPPFTAVQNVPHQNTAFWNNPTRRPYFDAPNNSTYANFGCGGGPNPRNHQGNSFRAASVGSNYKRSMVRIMKPRLQRHRNPLSQQQSAGGQNHAGQQTTTNHVGRQQQRFFLRRPYRFPRRPFTSYTVHQSSDNRGKNDRGGIGEWL